MMYEDLQKLHGLPKFEDLDYIFEISAIEEDDFYLRNIRRHIIERLKVYIEILEDLIHPNSTVSAYHECKFFDDEQKRKIYDLYGRLMSLVRSSNLLDLQQKPELDAGFIKDTHKSWPSLVDDMVKILKKLQACWSEEEISDKSVSSYFG